MARIDLPAATQWITVAAHAHGERLTAHVAERLAIDRRRARQLVAGLVQAQWLRREGPPRRPRYVPGPLRQVVQRYPFADLDVGAAWQRDVAPLVALAPNVAQLARHAFGALLDNALRHSGGSGATVSLRQTAAHVQLLVSDDGCGLFERVAASDGANGDPADVMDALANGMLTMAPAGGASRGLCIAARCADMAELHANACAFRRHAARDQRWTPSRALARRGTSVYLAIALDSPRTLDEVLGEVATLTDPLRAVTLRMQRGEDLRDVIDPARLHHHLDLRPLDR